MKRLSMLKQRSVQAQAYGQKVIVKQRNKMLNTSGFII